MTDPWPRSYLLLFLPLSLSFSLLFPKQSSTSSLFLCAHRTRHFTINFCSSLSPLSLSTDRIKRRDVRMQLRSENQSFTYETASQHWTFISCLLSVSSDHLFERKTWMSTVVLAMIFPFPWRIVPRNSSPLGQTLAATRIPTTAWTATVWPRHSDRVSRREVQGWEWIYVGLLVDENIFDQDSKPFQDYILRNTSNFLSLEQSCVLPFQQLVLNDIHPRTNASSRPFSYSQEALPFGSSHHANINDENSRPPWLLSMNGGGLNISHSSSSSSIITITTTNSKNSSSSSNNRSCRWSPRDRMSQRRTFVTGLVIFRRNRTMNSMASTRFPYSLRKCLSEVCHVLPPKQISTLISIGSASSKFNGPNCTVDTRNNIEKNGFFHIVLS